MNLREKLAEAQYIHRGENGKYISDQCGFGCDHSYLVNNDDSGRPCYRMCRRLGIRVDDYDSCRYFSNDREMDLIRQYAATIKREPGVTQITRLTAGGEEKERREMAGTYRRYCRDLLLRR